METWLHEELTGFEDADELTRFLATVVLGGHMQRLSEGERGPFAEAVAGEIVAEDGEPLLDYVRLNMIATRSGGDPGGDA